MSPAGLAANLYTGGFPRVSGDEPCSESKLAVISLFSPRERG